MSHEHTVVAGDSMPSLAKRYGFIWQSLWEHPNNRELAQRRVNPNTLMVGDVVFIPDIETKTIDIDTERRHRFRRRGIPSKLTLQLMDHGKPRMGIEYTIDLDDGTSLRGTTDDQGYVRHPVQPERQWGVVRVNGRWGGERYHVQLGHLDPIDEITGVQQRLANLGQRCTPTGDVDRQTSRALSNFQSRHQLERTGTIDDATRAKLLEICGS